MKKMFISREQFMHICEETTTLQFPTNNNDIGNVLSKGETQSQIQNAKSTFGGNVTAQFTPSDGPGESTISIPNSVGGTAGASEAIKDNSAEVQKALGNGINVGVDVSEVKKFKKKDIENARLSKIRKEGKIMTKKQLYESVVNDISSELEHRSVFVVLNAYKHHLGDPQELSTEQDMLNAIVKKYNESSPEQQSAFKQEIGI